MQSIRRAVALAVSRPVARSVALPLARPLARPVALPLALAAVISLAACSGLASAETEHVASGSGSSVATDAKTLRLGYFANVTHAPALVGVQKGIFGKDLGATNLRTEIFSAGPAAIEALSSGAIDAAYIGPSPAINSFVQSGGASLRVVSGAAIGGAQLVVRPQIKSVSDLKGKTLATPQLGNTQDTALRFFLKSKGLSSSLTGGGEVAITPTENAQTLALFKSGKVDGAWLPEPWASRLVIDAGAHVLVDEASLWPNGEFATTVLVVNAGYLREHPATVAKLVKANSEAVDWLTANPALAAGVINATLTKDAGAALSDAVITRALSFVHFSVDPLAARTGTLVDHAVSVGTAKSGNTSGLYELSALNKILKDSGRAPLTKDSK